ncbi:mitochondrial import inner membrane translocase subunit TIM17-3-like [Arachis stenosperma]|uniref:mitochondrial import inner membrane translocase subunit TIM17-3-like n=1 Tax=Arachis stenosperma TaxID=217475 RepID=UPI0025ABC651|nr:mitochondrial import inner membrane translocase subunit TIM17-3-like [Arachis stenosperma]
MASYGSETPEKALQQWLEANVQETGAAFKYALVGGSIFHFFKGLYRSPNGARLVGAWHAMGVNAPRVAGKFGAWFALSTAVDIALGYARQKDDLWNPIASTTIPTVLLCMHRGRAATLGFASLAAGLTVAMELSIPISRRYLAELDDKKKCLHGRCGK